MSDKIEKKVQEALGRHDRGYNCSQSVACTFCDELGFDEETMFRITEGMGLGMGSMDGTCGAIGAAAVLAGMKNSTVHLDHPDSKAVSYKAARQCLNEFKEQNGSVICRELKGVDTGSVLRSCNDCIADAVRIIETKLYGEDAE